MSRYGKTSYKHEMYWYATVFDRKTGIYYKGEGRTKRDAENLAMDKAWGYSSLLDEEIEVRPLTPLEIKRIKRELFVKSIYNSTIGVIILGIGLLMFFNDKVGLNLDFDPLMIYMFAGLCVLYGGFRLYRGLKKEM